MGAVGDQLDVGVRVLEQRGAGSGLAVVQPAHRVEQVGADPGARVQRRPRHVVRRVRVADRGDDPRGRDPAHGVEPAGQLGRERDHAQVAVGRLDQPVDLGGLRVGEQRGIVRADVLRAEPRALEVDPGERAGSGERGQLADRALQLGGGVGDQAGHDRGGAVGQVHGGHGLGGLRGPGVERRAAAAVHVRVDVPGHQRRCRGAPRRRGGGGAPGPTSVTCSPSTCTHPGAKTRAGVTTRPAVMITAILREPGPRATSPPRPLPRVPACAGSTCGSRTGT